MFHYSFFNRGSVPLAILKTMPKPLNLNGGLDKRMGMYLYIFTYVRSFFMNMYSTLCTPARY